MNTLRTPVRKSQNLPMNGFLNSLYYTFPVGMFLTACNFLFESVRNYYFNWWIVVLPTVAIFVVSNVYKIFLVSSKSRILFKEKKFISKSNDYAITKSKMVSELM